MKCGQEYFRDYRVRTARGVHEHKTGRKCDNPNCKGDLKDTIINFGENLREDILDMGYAHGSEADLMVCVGSSMRVNPAADMAGMTAKRGGNLVIINLMKTPLDPYATLVINGRCQQVFELLMKKLGFAVPEWNIKRHAKVSLETQAGKEYLKVSGVDTNNAPYDFMKTVSINRQVGAKVALKATEQAKDSVYKLNVGFQGYYNEPNLNLTIPRNLLTDNNKAIRVDMIYNPRKCQWEFAMSYDFHSKSDLDIIEFKNATDLAK